MEMNYSALRWAGLSLRVDFIRFSPPQVGPEDWKFAPTLQYAAANGRIGS